MEEIKFKNGSTIEPILCEECKRDQRTVLKLVEDDFRLKWYQKLQVDIICIWYKLLWKLGIERRD